MSELRYAFRSLSRRPGFSFVAIVTLALGIGAATTIFSVLNAVLFRPLPFPEQEQVVDISETAADGHGMAFAEPNFDDLRNRSRSFAGLARYNVYSAAVAGGSEAVQTNVCPASADFFRVLGVSPQVGRLFGVGTESKQVLVVSYGFWKRFLGGQTDLERLSLRFDNRSFAIIGVLPSQGAFPQTAEVWFPAEVNEPLPSRTAHNWRVIGRLKAGVAIGTARAELAVIGQQLKRGYGSETDAVSFGPTPLRERMVKDVRGALLVLGSAVGLLLLIACSNVANLSLVKFSARRHEIALRTALGASRARLARQFITESLLLASIAGVLGILLAFWSIHLLVGLYHGALPRVGEITIDRTVLLFALAIGVITGIVLGLVPVWHASTRQLLNSLQEAGRGLSTSRSNRRFHNGLVVAQIALTLLLLVGAGLLGRSFRGLVEIKPGFEPDRVVIMTVTVPNLEAQSWEMEPAVLRRLALAHQQLLARLQTIPGVTETGGVNSLPMSDSGANGTFIMLDGSDAPRSIAEFSKQLSALQGAGKTGDAQYRAASAGYFRVMGIPLRRGRLFQEADSPDGQHVAVVSEALARRYWPNADPIGKQIEFGNMDGDLRALTVIGVVGDIRDTLETEPQPMIYTNYFQRPAATTEFSFVVRSRGDQGPLIAAMRREAHAANPEMPTKFATVEQLLASSLDNRRFSVVTLGVFAGTALILAMVGLYGILAYVTAERTTEIGVRMALGAQRGDMMRLILRQSFTLVSLGIFGGVAGALAATRILGAFLFAVGPNDPVTFGIVVFLILLAGLLATLVPARRAMSVNPMAALRHE